MRDDSFEPSASTTYRMALRRWTGHGFLRAHGWRTVGERPRVERCVMIAAPHTSRTDLVYMLAFAFAFDLHINWFAKNTAFRGPARRSMQWLGGIPAERGSRRQQVAALAREFERRERLILAIAPEGNRFRTDHWKSGFYWIAREAGVPILPSFLDFATRTAGFGPLVWPSESMTTDMDRLREVYADKAGHHRERFGPVRLQEEMGSR